MTLPPLRATRALIHLDNLKHNIHAVRKKIGSECRICMPVKANAYGHGAVKISRAALEYGVDYLAVAAVSEGVQLKRNGIEAPVILLNHVLPEEMERVISLDLIAVVGSREYAELLNSEAKRKSCEVKVHLKVDTGMGRLGVYEDEALELAAYIFESSNLELSGICTHFPVSDTENPEDRVFTLSQTEVIQELVYTLQSKGISPGIVHAANSGAVAALPFTYFDMVRPGIALYGYEPMESYPLGVKPVMELESRIIHIKKVHSGQTISYGRTWTSKADTCIAVIPAGYGDGYNRLLSNKGKVLIGGQLFPVVGRVCMDQLMVDLGASPQVSLYDKVTLFGPDSRGPHAGDIASQIETIPYEVTCRIAPRVPRIFLK